MVNKSGNNGDGTNPPGTPNERAAKKQDTRGMPKKNRKNQQEDMEIDSSGGSGGETAKETWHRFAQRARTRTAVVQRMSICPALKAGVDDRITDRQSCIGAAFHSPQRATSETMTTSSAILVPVLGHPWCCRSSKISLFHALLTECKLLGFACSSLCCWKAPSFGTYSYNCKGLPLPRLHRWCVCVGDHVNRDVSSMEITNFSLPISLQYILWIF